MIFLGLHKVYDALYRSSCLEILEGYGVGPQARRFFRTYWRRLNMVARAGGYYGTALQGACGLTQGNPIFPTIFNLVVDAVVRHWVTGVIADAEERVRQEKAGRHQPDLFYADNGMVALYYPCWLQGDFNTLVGLFDRVGLRKNVGKTVGMVCHPFQASVNMSEAAYGRRVTGEVPTYRDILKGQVSCRGCGELMATGYLTSHLMTQHGRVAETRQRWRTLAAGGMLRTF